MKKKKTRARKPDEPAVSPGKSSAAGAGEFRVMTVALIREPVNSDAVEVAFSESARFYCLLRTNPKFEEILVTLRQAKEKRQALRVRTDATESTTIRDVELAEDSQR